jgi:hypothetical protein
MQSRALSTAKWRFFRLFFNLPARRTERIVVADKPEDVRATGGMFPKAMRDYFIWWFVLACCRDLG